MTRRNTDRYEVCKGTLIDTRLPVLCYDSPANPAPQSPTSFLSVFLRVISVIRDSDRWPRQFSACLAIFCCRVTISVQTYRRATPTDFKDSPP